MATIVLDPKQLPERTAPLPPGAKPPITSLPYKDLGDPGEVDEFLEMLREIRGHAKPRSE
jgi:hypothetical protein